jgi:hypothetical protein
MDSAQTLQAGCERLLEIALPDTVAVVEFQAFSCCDSLVMVAMPNMVRCLSLDAW